jgi:hypothetical protein
MRGIKLQYHKKERNDYSKERGEKYTRESGLDLPEFSLAPVTPPHCGP